MTLCDEDYLKAIYRLGKSTKAMVSTNVMDSSEAFLNFLDKNHIAPGDKIKVLDQEEFDGSLHIKIKKRRLHISNQIAGNLYLEIQ